MGIVFYFFLLNYVCKDTSNLQSVKGEIKLGESSRLTANVSNAGDFVKNVSEAETWKGAGLQP